MSNDSETKPPLIPSLLYTQGDENVKQAVEDDLKILDPETEAAQAAIVGNTKEWGFAPTTEDDDEDKSPKLRKP